MQPNATRAPGHVPGRSADQVRRRRSDRHQQRNARYRFFQPTIEQLEQRMLLAALVARPYDLSPLAFERNEGQLAADVAYAARGADFSLLLTNDGAVLGLGGSEFATRASTSTDMEQQLSGPGDQRADGTTTELLVQMSWLNGRQAAAAEGLDQMPGVTNYVWGDDPSAWRTGIASFERVRYDEVYDGIDLEFYSRGGDIEFDWIVAPHVDPSQITMVYAGMDNLSLDAGGNLVIAAGKPATSPARAVRVSGRCRAAAGGGSQLSVGRRRRGAVCAWGV